MSEDQLERMAASEESLVRELGERIGYGRIIQLCERIWGEKLPGGVSPAAHATAELQRFRERESLVQALLQAFDEADDVEDNLHDACCAVRDFEVT